ncbi:MAG: DinB family protein [Burkholderiaceae bacterium]
MNAIAHLKALADYNLWINARLLDAAERLSTDERNRDLGAFFGSINGTFNHLMIGDSIWLRRFATAEGRAAAFLAEHESTLAPLAPLDGIVETDAAALRRRRQDIDALISDWVGRLDTDQLDRALAYRNTQGRPFSRQLGLLALHFFNHQTHHRGQISTLLFQSGIDPGVTDLLARIPEIV